MIRRQVMIYYRSSGEANILVGINPTDMPYDLKTDLSMQEMIYSIGDKPDLRKGRCIIKERSASLWVVK